MPEEIVVIKIFSNETDAAMAQRDYSLGDATDLHRLVDWLRETESSPVCRRRGRG